MWAKAMRLRQDLPRETYIVGEVRRMVDDPKDISLLIVEGAKGDFLYKKAFDWMKVRQAPGCVCCTDDLNHGHVDGVRVNVEYCYPQWLGAAMLFWTGPSAHWEALVSRARGMGLHLDHMGLAGSVELADQGELYPCARSEEGIYEALGMEFIPPQKRGPLSGDAIPQEVLNV
jgi:DNA polymerase/3'-5' exonuclease PolX